MKFNFAIGQTYKILMGYRLEHGTPMTYSSGGSQTLIYRPVVVTKVTRTGQAYFDNDLDNRFGVDGYLLNRKIGSSEYKLKPFLQVEPLDPTDDAQQLQAQYLAWKVDLALKLAVEKAKQQAEFDQKALIRQAERNEETRRLEEANPGWRNQIQTVNVPNNLFHVITLKDLRGQQKTIIYTTEKLLVDENKIKYTQKDYDNQLILLAQSQSAENPSRYDERLLARLAACVPEVRIRYTISEPDHNFSSSSYRDATLEDVDQEILRCVLH